MIDINVNSKVYIDTNIFIYFIEQVEPFYGRVKDLLALMSDVGATICTSELTVAECLHRPFRNGDKQLVETYELLFEQSGDVGLVELSGILAKRAVANGAPIGLKLADAIHYISALDEGCDVFVSSDAKFKSTKTMHVITL